VALETDFTLAQAYSADEAFVTGTLGGVTPVTHIDGRVIGDGTPGPLTAQASAQYLKPVAGGHGAPKLAGARYPPGGRAGREAVPADCFSPASACGVLAAGRPLTDRRCRSMAGSLIDSVLAVWLENAGSSNS
jgi:hypothetical protein